MGCRATGCWRRCGSMALRATGARGRGERCCGTGTWPGAWRWPSRPRRPCWDRSRSAWLARLEREHDNLRAALQWALERNLSTLGLRVAVGLWKFWRSRGHLREGQRWFAALLAPAAEDEDATSMALRASALEGAGWIAQDGQDFARAAALFARSGALRRALGAGGAADRAADHCGMEARAAGDYARATALFEESLAQHRRSAHPERPMDDDLGLTLSLSNRYTLLALVLREQGAYARASALYEECLALHRDLGDRQGMASAWLGLGDIARDQGDAARVRAYCEDCLLVFREYGLIWAIGFSLNNLALAALMAGDMALAARHAEESEASSGSWWRGRGWPRCWLPWAV